MERVALAVRAWLGTMFVYSAALKLAHYDQAGRTVTPYRIAPQRLEGAAGFALPWAELFAAASLLLGRLYPFGPLVSAMLGSAFAYGSFDVTRRRADVPCGCTGSTSERVTRATLGRAVAITSGSLLVLAARRRTYSRLPAVFVVCASLLSIVPALIDVSGRVRHARRHTQRKRHNKEAAESLTRVLASPPGQPIALNQSVSSVHRSTTPIVIADALPRV